MGPTTLVLGHFSFKHLLLANFCFYIFFPEAIWLLQKDEERPKEKEKGKTRAIDKFLEELKYEQELREKRSQEREQWREGRHSENSAVSTYFHIPMHLSIGHFVEIIADLNKTAVSRVFQREKYTSSEENNCFQILVLFR